MLPLLIYLLTSTLPAVADQEDGSLAHPQLWPLDTLVQGCDRIVEANVREIEELEGMRRLIDLDVREVLWGEPVDHLTVVADSSNDVHGPLTKGEKDFWFLERWRFPTSAAEAKRSVDQRGPFGFQIAAGRLPVVQAGPETQVRLRRDRLSLPSGFVATPIETPTGCEGTWVRSERAQFIGWVRKTLTVSVPSVHTEWFNNGPSNQSIDLRPDGRCTFNDHGKIKEERLAPSALLAVIAAADKERFFELPGTVGRSLGPDSTVFEIRIRTQGGSRLVQIEGPCQPAMQGQAADDTCDRANRVLHSIPHAGTWIVTGH